MHLQHTAIVFAKYILYFSRWDTHTHLTIQTDSGNTVYHYAVFMCAQNRCSLTQELLVAVVFALTVL